MLRATTVCTFSTSNGNRIVKKWSEHVVFCHFDFQLCFAPQRPALFRHLTFEKWSQHGVFCTCSLPNVLRATRACTFVTSQLPKVLRDRCALTLFTSTCASRHNGPHFFDISSAKSALDLRCFVHFHFHTCFAPQRRAIVHLSSAQMTPHPPL